MLVSVPIITNGNWKQYLKVTLTGMVNRSWQFGKNIDHEKLDLHDALKDYLFSSDAS